MDDGHGFYLQVSTLYLQYAMCIVLLINTAGRIDYHTTVRYKLPTKLVCKSILAKLHYDHLIST